MEEDLVREIIPMPTNTELEYLLMKLGRAEIPEVLELEFFLENDPDIEMKDALYNFIRKQYYSHTHAVRSRKLKEARGGQPKQYGTANTTPDPPPPPGKHPNVIEFEGFVKRLDADHNVYIEDDQFYREVSEKILSYNWNFKPRSTNKFTPEEDTRFLTEIADKDYLSSEGQKYRIRLTTRDFLKWLIKEYQQPQTKGSNNGAT